MKNLDLSAPPEERQETLPPYLRWDSGVLVLDVHKLPVSDARRVLAEAERQLNGKYPGGRSQRRVLRVVHGFNNGTAWLNFVRQQSGSLCQTDVANRGVTIIEF